MSKNLLPETTPEDYYDRNNISDRKECYSQTDKKTYHSKTNIFVATLRI